MVTQETSQAPGAETTAVPTEPAAPGPSPSRDVPRYRLERAGIRNVWQYDDHVMEFAEGRLLLRGRNGAGKSKALEMLLPFLLDGDVRRLDTTGTNRTSESITEVLAARPLDLRAEHHVLDRIEQHVRQRIVTALERVVWLAVAVVDIHVRVTDRARHFLAPVDVEERHQTKHWQHFTDDGSHGVTKVVPDTDVGGRIVHVVLDALAIHRLQPQDVLPDVDVRAQVDAPAPIIAR